MEISSHIKPLMIFIFNIKEYFYHHITDEEILLIRSTHLFDYMDKNLFEEMLHTIHCVKYQPGQIICHEGELGDTFYAIAEGSVRVFTYDTHGRKVPLARLNRGDYFGEQALLGEAYKTRNANIETITDTKVLQINEKFITHLLQADIGLKNKIKQSGFEQLLKIISLATGFYTELKTIISQIKNPVIYEFTAGDLIFHKGDVPDNAYIILEGDIKLLITNKDKEVTQLFLHRGQIFGELSILKDKRRAATAIAETNTRLLAIHKDEFSEYLIKYPEFKKLLNKINQIYLLPMKGTIDQQVVSKDEEGSTNETNCDAENKTQCFIMQAY